MGVVEKQIQAMIELAQKGKRHSDIAKALGIADHIVTYHVSRTGIDVQAIRKVKKMEYIKQLRAMGYTLENIRKLYGFSQTSYLCRLLKRDREGIEKKP